MRWSAAQALSWIICQEAREIGRWTRDMGPKIEAAQKLLAEAIGAERVQAWGRPQRDAELETIPSDLFRIDRLPVVVNLHGEMVSRKPFKPYDGRRWTSIEFDANQVKRAFPSPPSPSAEQWMLQEAERLLKNQGRPGKRDLMIKDCISATGCTKRQAETAHKNLPNHVKRSRGRPKTMSEAASA